MRTEMKENEMVDVRFVCMREGSRERERERVKKRERRGCDMMDGKRGEGAWG